MYVFATVDAATDQKLPVQGGSERYVFAPGGCTTPYGHIFCRRAFCALEKEHTYAQSTQKQRDYPFLESRETELETEKRETAAFLSGEES